LGINQDWSNWSVLSEQFNPDKEQFPTVICSIDKDLHQIPGLHYNFVKKEWSQIEPWDGLKWFYQQLLIGDSTDGIKGCSGIGPVNSWSILGPIGCGDGPTNGGEGERKLFEATFKAYQKKEGKSEKRPSGKTDEEILSHISLIGKLLKIKQQENEPEWSPPKLFQSLSQTVASPLSSTPQTREEPTQSTEPTRPQECGSPLLGKQMESIVPDSAST
jgi:5'-3' exonuclease